MASCQLAGLLFRVLPYVLKYDSGINLNSSKTSWASCRHCVFMLVQRVPRTATDEDR